MSTQADVQTVFKIPSENLAKFEKACAALSRKAVKIGCEEIKPFVFGYEMVEMDGRTVKVLEVLLTAEAPKINGWTFVARLDHSNDTGNIVRMVPNTAVALPETFRTSKPVCEHCNKARMRRDTFVLHCTASNEFKQVGSTCLQDFFGHDPIKMARMAELLGYAYEAGRASEFYDLGTDHRWVNVERYLELSAAAIRQYGWVSARTANETGKEATRETAFSFYCAERAGYTVLVTEEDRMVAQEAVMWAAGLRDKANPSDYEHNVMVVAEAEFIELRSIGIAASIVGVYLKNRDENARKAAEASRRGASQHVGAVGDKLKNVSATITGKHSFEGAYGFTTILKMLSNDGNVLTWFASKGCNVTVGDKVVVSGTVKSHGAYKDVLETCLTRAKVEKV